MSLGVKVLAGMLVAVCCMHGALGQPSIRANGPNLTLSASDIIASFDGGGPTVSLRQLAADITALRTTAQLLLNASAQTPTTAEVLQMVDAAVAGALAQSVPLLINQSVSPLNSRVTANEGVLSGLPQTRAVVANLSRDVNYLISHAQNVSTCAASGNVHLNGSCVDTVPQCPQPSAVVGGNITLSSSYIIPGVTATYSCPGALQFVAGPTVRTCNATTRLFSGPEPRCLTCAVSNCLQCVSNVNTCARCATGHDLSANRQQCIARSETVLILGGQYSGSRHNFNQIQSLAPNANSWNLFRPYPPISGSLASAALIRGNLYLVGAGGHGSLTGYHVLNRGSTRWATFPGTNGFNGPATFHANVNGVSTQADGFYMFGLQQSAVFQPFGTVTDRWTTLPAFPAAISRNYGATAVVGANIYCLGGWAPNAAGAARYSRTVNIFNTATRSWSTGTPMTSGRRNHAATAYNGKIYVFGGRLATNVVTTLVEEFDPATNRWTTKQPMTEAWELMGTAPLPVFPDGTVVIPFSFKRQNSGVVTSLVYNIQSNSWSSGARPAIQLGRYAMVQGSLQ